MPDFIDSSGTIGGPARQPTDAVVDVAADLCREGRYLEAHDLLERTASEPGFHVAPGRSPRFRSYYGLTLAMALGEMSRGERMCREAMEAGGADPELSHNLGMLYLRCRRRDLAFENFNQVLEVAPYFPETHRTLDRLGRRRKPVFTFLPRSHPINRYSGKVLYHVRRAWESLHQPAAA